MTIKQYRDNFIQELTPIHGADEAESFFYLILEDKNKLRRIDLALQPELAFSKVEIEYYKCFDFSWWSLLFKIRI